MGERLQTMSTARRSLLAGVLAAALLSLCFAGEAQAVTMSLDKQTYVVSAGSSALALFFCSGCNLPGAQLVISTGSTAVATVSPTSYFPTETTLNLNLTLTGVAAGETTVTVALYQGATLVISVFSRVNVSAGCPVITAFDGVSNSESKLGALYEFRDRFLGTTPKGREYTRLFYQHAGEVTWLLLRYPDLRAQVRGVLEKILPAIETAVAEQRLAIPAADLDEIDEVVNTLSARGSPKLRQAIQKTWPEVSNALR